MIVEPKMTEQYQPIDKYITVGELRLHYVDWGNAKANPMVLLHGLGDCTRNWDIFANTMSSDYHVIALDHRGHGDSDWAETYEYKLGNYFKDIKAFVSQLKLNDVIFVGHGLGANSAFLYAADSPEVIKALVVLSSELGVLNSETFSKRQIGYRRQHNIDFLESLTNILRKEQPYSQNDWLISQAIQMSKSLPGDKRIWKCDPKTLSNYEQPNLWEQIAKIKTPTLIMRGRQNDLQTHEIVVRMREIISNARLVELEGGGHWFHLENPYAFEDTVGWFLQDILP